MIVRQAQIVEAGRALRLKLSHSLKRLDGVGVAPNARMSHPELTVIEPVIGVCLHRPLVRIDRLFLFGSGEVSSAEPQITLIGIWSNLQSSLRLSDRFRG